MISTFIVGRDSLLHTNTFLVRSVDTGEDIRLPVGRTYFKT